MSTMASVAESSMAMTPNSTKEGAMDQLDISHDFDSLSSKADTLERHQASASFVDGVEFDGTLPPSPPSSTHSGSAHGQSHASHDIKPVNDHLPPLRPAYLYLDGEDAEPPLEPTADIKGVPVFTPTWEEFRDFYSYCSRIDEWGMHSGIVKIIPPKEWIDALPRLDGKDPMASTSKAGERYTEANRLSQVRIKNSIEQLFTPAGVGVWRQSNVVHPARIVNAKQWADICAQDSQRGPEMRRMKEVAKRKHEDVDEDGVRTRSGRGAGTAGSQAAAKAVPAKRKTMAELEEAHIEASSSTNDDRRETRSSQRKAQAEVKQVSGNKPKMAERTTQAEWDAFEYARDWCREAGQEAEPKDWDMAVCHAIEGEYWRGLNYGKAPMYGADLSGTLFTPDTKEWNVGRLDNILTRLRLKRKLPGVTTPYLYFGMWRATFAWHVEDMDLYSINYIHFGAPKQWYSIRQADKQRFELAMASAFPADSSRCRHFMRHKSYLASPTFIEAAAGRIKPLRLVQRAQEIVLTYPYGYHSGYNLGFNCAESVNFALDRWLDIGRRATYCECTDDTVKMDVDAMLDESKEMEELERRRVERERRREEGDAVHGTEEERAQVRRARERERRRRRKEHHDRLVAQGLATARPNVDQSDDEDGPPAKKVKLDYFPCEFCPSYSLEDLILIPNVPVTGKLAKGQPNVKRAHRLCASFLPETWVAPNTIKGLGRGVKEVVENYAGIPKARWSLKCQNCKDPALSKRGAKMQCTYGRCSRTSHVSCALDEESGWFLDVLPEAEADEIEGRKKVKPAKKGKGRKGEAVEERTEQTPAASEGADDDDESDPRMVVLCRTHNPQHKEREAQYNADILRVCLGGLVSGQRIRIRANNGIWETTLDRYEAPPSDADHLCDEGDVVLMDGSRFKGAKVVFDQETMRKAEDVVWYRDEAEYLREMGLASDIVTVEEETKPSVLEQHQRQLEEEQRQKEERNAARQAERDRRASELERKRKEAEGALTIRTSVSQTPSDDIARPRTPVVPSQPAGSNVINKDDAYNYARQWLHPEQVVTQL